MGAQLSRRMNGRKAMRVALIFCLGVAFFAAVSPARADTMGTVSLSGCGGGGGCPAATYTFDITSTTAMLTITITGTPTSSNDMIGSVDLGFSPSGSISGLALTSAPSALGNWGVTTGSLSSNGNGCGTNTGAFICSTALPSNPLPISQGGVYTWTWTFNPVSQINLDVHVGTQYGPNNPNNPWKGLIVSQTVFTPEPTSVTLLAAGLLALALLGRKFSRA
jgi:hypothetical protein